MRTRSPIVNLAESEDYEARLDRVRLLVLLQFQLMLACQDLAASAAPSPSQKESSPEEGQSRNRFDAQRSSEI
jgi:hypothetical protein